MLCINNVYCGAIFVCRYDHQARLTAQEAMAHPYFAPIRAAESSASLGGGHHSQQHHYAK